MNFKKLVILTNMPSPYQVDFFNTLSAHIKLKVIYAQKSLKERKWKYEGNIKHPHTFLSGSFIKRVSQLKKLSDEKDTVYIVSGYDIPEFIYFMTLLSKRKRKWLFWGEKIRLNKLSLKRRTVLRLLKNARAILGIGEVAARLYHELTGITTFNLPYHINTSRFKRDSYFQDNRVNFVYSGQIIERKGVIYILDAFESIVERFNDAVALHIAGDGPLFKYIKERTKTYEARVRFYGFVRYEELPIIYQKGDVFLFPSIYDGWGVALAEGMASGMAPISTYSTGASTDLILHGYNGFIIPPENSKMLAHYMEQLINKQELIRKFGNRARRYVISNNDVKSGVEKLLNILSLI